MTTKVMSSTNNQLVRLGRLRGTRMIIRTLSMHPTLVQFFRRGKKVGV